MGRAPFLYMALQLLFDRHHCCSGSTLRLCFLPHCGRDSTLTISASTQDQQAALPLRTSDSPSLTMHSSGAIPTQHLFSSSRHVRLQACTHVALCSSSRCDPATSFDSPSAAMPIMRESASHAFCVVPPLACPAQNLRCYAGPICQTALLLMNEKGLPVNRHYVDYNNSPTWCAPSASSGASCLQLLAASCSHSEADAQSCECMQADSRYRRQDACSG